MKRCPRECHFSAFVEWDDAEITYPGVSYSASALRPIPFHETYLVTALPSPAKEIEVKRVSRGNRSTAYLSKRDLLEAMLRHCRWPLMLIISYLSNLPWVNTQYPVSQLDKQLLEVVQVYAPPVSPKDSEGLSSCSFTLMEHVFGQSAGKPFIGIGVLVNTTINTYRHIRTSMQ
jgi:hypothetical protein